jgi:DsbE subfamily thiol:disulfide oxidoreductase
MSEQPAPTPEPTTPALPTKRRLSRRAAVVAFISVIGGLAIIVVGLMELQNRGTEGISGVSVADRQAAAQTENSPAPSFSMETLDGGTVSLDEMRGEIVVINFWATWCGPCRQEAPAFRRLSREYGSQGVRFLGINERDDRASAQAFVREFKLDYPSVFDPAGRLAYDFALYAMPTTFVVDPDGIIRYRFVGYLTEADLRGAIEDLLEEGR